MAFAIAHRHKAHRPSIKPAGHEKPQRTARERRPDSRQIPTPTSSQTAQRLLTSRVFPGVAGISLGRPVGGEQSAAIRRHGQAPRQRRSYPRQRAALRWAWATPRARDSAGGMARWRARRLLPLLTFVTLGMILGEQPPLSHIHSPSLFPPAPSAVVRRVSLDSFLSVGWAAWASSPAESRACFWLGSFCRSDATELSVSPLNLTSLVVNVG